MTHENCLCHKYGPDLEPFQIRMNGDNFYCMRCNGLVSKKKWKGGIVKFGNRIVYKKYYECPCCGYRMRAKRRNKKKQIDSIEHQLLHPEEHLPKAQTVLPKKIALMQKNILLARIS